MKYILILKIWNAHGLAVTTSEFTAESLCKKAAVTLEARLNESSLMEPWQRAVAVCVEK